MVSRRIPRNRYYTNRLNQEATIYAWLFALGGMIVFVTFLFTMAR